MLRAVTEKAPLLWRKALIFYAIKPQYELLAIKQTIPIGNGKIFCVTSVQKLSSLHQVIHT